MGQARFIVSRLFRHGQRLFHLLVGIAFLGLALVGAEVAFAAWRDYQRRPDSGPAEFAVIAGFTLLLVVFGLYSFVKARSVR
jgi:hypothetical protein